MANTVAENADIVLTALYNAPPGSRELEGSQIADLTGLNPDQINDAVTILVEAGLAEWLLYMGTHPYSFGHIAISARGRYEREKAMVPATNHDEVAGSGGAPIALPPTPVGSPFGFTDHDWEYLAEKRSRRTVLAVVFGYQFRSEHYDPDRLLATLTELFTSTVDRYNALPESPGITLEFASLAAGYGEHLFNEITRDILAADIAVFDTSDLNPNVMLEMGVALTWGVRVLPIRAQGSPIPPSDISGQTWVEYINSGAHFEDAGHGDKLLRMVQRCVRKKV